jgi:hypothetical protein
MVNNKVCFVLMGYGIKTDYQTGRKLDLDKTFEFLIKPVFDDLNITCLRASDIPHSGPIDVPMYENILKADIVVADISTLNCNAIYELGVRHALRPETTIIIAEKELVKPFDLSHIIITPYEHLGSDIGASEVRRFSKELKNMVQALLKTPAVDSPVYTFLTYLTPPQFSKQEVQQLKAVVEQGDSLSSLLKEAEDLKNQKDFLGSCEKLEQAKKYSSTDPSVIQKLALVTYKSKLPDVISALTKAEEILNVLNPDITNDSETLGLAGAINKRLYEETELDVYLKKSIAYYERGFILSRDYYNGINLAYLYLLSSSIVNNKNDRIADFINAKRTRDKTRAICLSLIERPNFPELPDRTWILFTLAEIESVEGNENEAQNYVNAAKKQGAKPFEISSYEEQEAKIKNLLSKIKIE